MPYIFISAVALCANLYRCAPLIVGDKFADPELMKFLGAKITTDYPEPNSPPMYVMFATMREVLDALQEIGYELNSSHMVQGYTTWILSKPVEAAIKDRSETSIKAEKSITSEIDSEPEAKATPKPRRPKRRTKEKPIETIPREVSAADSGELQDSSSITIKQIPPPKPESEYAREERPRRPVPEIDEATSTRDLPSSSSRKLLGYQDGTPRDTSRRQFESESSSKGISKTGSDASRPDSVNKRQELDKKDSQISEKQEPEPRVEATDSESPSYSRKLKGRGSTDNMAPHEKHSKHRGHKGVKRKSSSMSTPVKENFKN
ncbi:hypothetical protein GE061_013618 [Apolygus lucorum]|uniref:Uncharacterized protein n=1 Tax=Apolygus lucorum TaxID=248454 RepID=A0A6A4KCX6_APOLU|nr:hypothetical protein GE061_013618 [Apolygus lucorum]